MDVDVVTTIPITATSMDAATGIDGWSDYTEYGAPRAGSSTTATSGTVGYGWLGAKQRSTATETAGLTLMGVGSTTPAPAGSRRSIPNPAETPLPIAIPTTGRAAATHFNNQKNFSKAVHIQWSYVWTLTQRSGGSG